MKSDAEAAGEPARASGEHGGGARARLLATAAQLFYRQGYYQTGINQIIDEAGVAKASFYNHFPSKEDLGLAYVRRRHEEWMRGLRGRVEAQETPEERLEAVFDHLEAFATREGFRGCGQLNMAAEFPESAHRIRAQIREQKQAVRDYLAEIVQGVASADDADEEEAKATADAVYLLYEASLVESQNFGDAWPARAARVAARHQLGLPRK